MAKVFIEESTLSAIGDAIREKEGSTDLVPVTDMASRISAISGGDSYYDTFWDNYQQNGSRTHYIYGFAGLGWNANNFKPKYNMTPQYATAMFRQFSYPIDLVSYLESLGITLDFSQSLYCDSLFYASQINHVGVIDASNCTNGGIAEMFAYNSKIETVDKLIVKPTLYFSNTFNSATGLKNITFEGEIGENINFVSCKKLSRDSMDSIRDHLSDSVTGKTCTFSQVAVYWGGFEHSITPPDLIPGVDAGPIDESEWVAWKSVKPNWTITYL